MAGSNRRGHIVAAPHLPHMSPDFHRHGLFHPRRSAVSQLSKAPSVVGRIRKEALQPARRIRTGRPSALPKPHHCCGRFYYFFAALFSRPCRLFFRYPRDWVPPYAAISRKASLPVRRLSASPIAPEVASSLQSPFPAKSIGHGAAECSRGGWGCGISLYPTAERTPCFSATPSIGTQNATAASEPPPRPRSAALLSPYARPAQRIKPLQPPSAAHARRVHHFASIPALKSSNATKI